MGTLIFTVYILACFGFLYIGDLCPLGCKGKNGIKWMNISLASTPGFCFLIAEFIFLHSLLMSRRSPRKKAISPEIILDSDDEDFAAVASDDPYVASFLFGWS